MTENREDYIKIIFQLEENAVDVTNKILAQKLNVSPASASQMVNKLSESGLVDNSGGYIILTEEARNLAKELISKHRLWEFFLLDHFNYKWDQVHADAELLEHVTSPLMLSKLNEYLDYPSRCPHGGRIYINEIEEDIDYPSLFEIEEKSKVKIIRFIDEYDLISFTKKIGLEVGDEVEIFHRDSLNEFLNIEYKGNRSVISYKVASMIFVERI